MKNFCKILVYFFIFCTTFQQTVAQEITQANAYLQIGEKNLQMGRNDIALENYQKALLIYQKTYTEKNDLVADCYNHLGIVYWNTGNNELALDYLHKALHIRQSLYQENHAEVAASYNDIGLLYANTKPFVALEYYQKALAIYQKVYPENHPSIATSYNNIAFVQHSQKQYEEAIINFNKALEIRKIVYEKDHPNEAFIYLSLGQVYSDLDKYDNALEYYEKALKIYQKNYGEKHPEIAQIYNLLATLYLKRSDFEPAIKYVQKALEANVIDFFATNNRQNSPIKNYYSGNFLLNSLLLKAQIYENLHYQKTLKFKDLTTALTCLELADSLLVELRQLRTNKNDKIALGITATEVYEEAIRLCMQMAEVTVLGAKKNYEKRAFAFAEKSKSAVLLSAISDTQAKEFAGIPKEILEEEKELKAEITLYEQALTNKKDEQIARNKLFELNRKYEVFVKDLEKKFPAYYNLKYNIKLSTVDSVQKNLPKETAMLSYFIAEKQQKIYIFVLTKHKFKAYAIKKEENFDNSITILRNTIIYKVQKEYVEVAQKLHQQLVPMQLANKIKNLIVVPDGRLATIPFEVLLYKKTAKNSTILYSNLPYLLKKYAISYAYSATLFTQNNNKINAQANNSMCLIAPIHFQNFSTLQDSEKEVNTLASLNPNAKIYLRGNAQEKLLQTAEIQEANYLHFATHGVVDELIPEKSRIMLYADSSKKNDGIVYAPELYNIKLRANLVVLSACQTGSGKISRGEGIIGLTRPLLYAGAKNLLVSLWKVADASTAQLMIDFYKPFLANTSQTYRGYASYLQKAKLKMIADNVYAAPFYWSPFFLIGQ
jgi:CHAT domain-containing protein/Tfp pilus assembly protein PilF